MAIMSKTGQLPIFILLKTSSTGLDIWKPINKYINGIVVGVGEGYMPRNDAALIFRSLLPIPYLSHTATPIMQYPATQSSYIT